MKTLLSALLVTVLVTGSSFGAEKKLSFPGLGYSIAPLDAKPPAGVPFQHLMMFLPGDGTFSANVGVQVQPYAESLEKYVKLSESQFKQMKLKVIRSRVEDGAAIFEYSGVLQGNLEMHYYSRALQRDGKVYLVTGTTLEKDWSVDSKALKASVDSFKLESVAKKDK